MFFHITTTFKNDCLHAKVKCCRFHVQEVLHPNWLATQSLETISFLPPPPTPTGALSQRRRTKAATKGSKKARRNKKPQKPKDGDVTTAAAAAEKAGPGADGGKPSQEGGAS